MNWVIDDSEEEEEHRTFLKPPEPQAKGLSSISDFSSRDNLNPTADKPSSISNFTTDNVVDSTGTVPDTIIVASTSAPALAKPKRPRPRPAYKGRVEGPDSIDQSTSVASVTANAINQISPHLSYQPLLDPTFSFDIAERTKTRKRNTTGGSTSGMESMRYSSSFRGPNSAATESSKDVIITISSDVEQEQAGPAQLKRGVKKSQGPKQSCQSPTFHVPTLPHADDTSTLPPSDPPSSVILTTRAPSPLFDHQRKTTDSTPPSSPLQPRKVKRRIIDADIDLDDDIGVDNGKGHPPTFTNEDGEPSTKKQKRIKEKKPRRGKATAAIEGDIASLARTSTVNTKKRQSKVKEKASEQEFKSKEFVEDSDVDDLLLVPKSSKSAPHASYSDPASAQISMQASIDASVQASVLAPTKMAQASHSILPSLSASARPSVAIPEPPSTDISAPPSSPSIPRVSKSAKSKSDKQRKKVASVTDTSSSVASKREDKKGKKKAEVSVFIDETGKQGTSSARDDAGAAELDISVAGKMKPKAKRDCKKRGTIISSDEDEPESISSKDNPVEMEVEKTKTKESRSEDKENEALLSPRVQQQKTPAPSSSASTSVAQARQLNSKSQISTPKMPPRRDSMSALIRRANSKVQSPLGTPSPAYAHSPLAKVSRRSVSRMAPLHPNRRTPPPAPPRPPPPKKSKKMLELEEKWEMELAETVEGWSCMTDDERAALRRAKRDKELGYED